MSWENRNYAFAGAFVDELARCGLRQVCVCPGSRSSPLAISFARHPNVKTWVHLDERSAAFFALGMARALGEPTAVVCTSGTAAANFYPAVVEARYFGVPLLVLTADRPPEMHEWGALQTIDQGYLYGRHAKWSVSMPTPEATKSLLGFVRGQACRVYATAEQRPPGPVHVNFPFREPLEPVEVLEDFPNDGQMSEEAWKGREGGYPFIAVFESNSDLSVPDLTALAFNLAKQKRGVIVCGPQSDPKFASSVTNLAHSLGYPILADSLSQVRSGSHDQSLVVGSYDAFLRVPALAESSVPEVVIRFGAVPVSKTLTQYLERHPRAHHILVDGNHGWNDPFQLTRQLVHMDPRIFCERLISELGDQAVSNQWIANWLSLDKVTSSNLNRQLDMFDEMFEGKIFHTLAELLPEGSTLFVGNSMPVRDLDTFFPVLNRPIRFMANRGASGIDGVLSTALGVSSLSVGNLVLVLGDLSFYHDMNALLLAKSYGLNATIIVVNNNGGGIFSFLPQVDYGEVFEPYFGTPHGLKFRSACELYGLKHTLAEDWPSFRRAVVESLACPSTQVIEVPGDRSNNVAYHRKVWANLAQSMPRLMET